MSEFHFLRPLWLLALPVGWWLIWLWLGAGSSRRGGWRRVVDERLRPYVLTAPDALRAHRLPLAAALLAWTLAVVALAGPSADRIEVPAFRSEDALVVALDLSRSMNAADVEPDRVTRAKLKVLSLLERRESGQTALVVFSAHAFTVTPLTSDTRTISALVSSLSTDIMPSRGSRPEAGLARAGQLLRQTGLRRGEVLLVTDTGPTEAGRDAARELVSDGFRVHVLAVGTAEGGPIADDDGGFVLDSAGDVVVPQVDFEALDGLASAGNGRFARLAADDSDLDRLLPRAATPLGRAPAGSDAGDGRDLGADVRRDDGVWLVVLLLPLLALTFRRGWIAAVAAVLVLPAPRASAFEWADLWKRPDQQGMEALEADAPAEAAERFEDPEWRAVAQYRAGEFEDSARSLTGIDSAEALYNRGTALAKAGQIRAAIAAYERALELEPGHADAEHNKALLEELLEQQNDAEQPASGPRQAENSERPGERDEQPQQRQQGADAEGGQRERSASQARESGAEQGGSAGESSGERPSDAQRRRESGAGERETGERRQAESEPSAEDAAGPDGEAETDERDAEGEQLAAAPDDLEQWTSDQAAEQWLRRVPQDPGGLLRRKFLYQYQRLGVDQEGNRVRPDDETEPW